MSDKKSTVGIVISQTGLDEIESQLARIPMKMRERAMARGFERGGKIIAERAKQLRPKGGPRTGVKRHHKHLRDTIGVVVRHYGYGVWLTVVGPQHPAGAHGHLVEHGHRMVVGGSVKPLPGSQRVSAPTARGGRTGKGRVVGHVQPYPFLAPAAAETAQQVEQMVIATVTEAVEKALRSG